MSEPVVSSTSEAMPLSPPGQVEQRAPSSFREAMEARNAEARARLAASPGQRTGLPASVRGAVDSTAQTPAPQAQQPGQRPQQPGGEARKQDIAEGARQLQESLAAPDDAAPDELEPEGAPQAAPDDRADLERYRAMQDAMDLDESMHDKLVKVKINGRESLVSVKEAAEGYQRLSDFTNSNKALKLERAQFEQERERDRAYVRNVEKFERDISNPKELVPSFMRANMMHVFHEAAVDYANRLAQYRTQNGPESIDKLVNQWKQGAHESETERIRRENATLRQQLAERNTPQPNDEEQQREHVKRQLAQLKPRAFQQHGLPDGIEFVNQVFYGFLAELTNGQEITPEACAQAARATSEVWADERQAAQAQFVETQRKRAASSNPAGSHRGGTRPGAARPQDVEPSRSNFRQWIAEQNHATGARNPWGA